MIESKKPKAIEQCFEYARTYLKYEACLSRKADASTAATIGYDEPTVKQNNITQNITNGDST
jgi:hypothetical protein